RDGAQGWKSVQRREHPGGQMIRASTRALLALLAAAIAVPVYAQGGGASTTGTIPGRVADASGAALPGATATAASRSLIGLQTHTSRENGSYRFPAVAPGVYTLTFELPGFKTIKREGIQINLGFAAAVNEEMSVASVQETVTVKGDSPVIDTSASRVQE